MTKKTRSNRAHKVMGTPLLKVSKKALHRAHRAHFTAWAHLTPLNPLFYAVCSVLLATVPIPCPYRAHSQKGSLWNRAHVRPSLIDGHGHGHTLKH